MKIKTVKRTLVAPADVPEWITESGPIYQWELLVEHDERQQGATFMTGITDPDKLASAAEAIGRGMADGWELDETDRAALLAGLDLRVRKLA